MHVYPPLVPFPSLSLGISMLELSCDLELPGNGPLWHQLRRGDLPGEFARYLSVELYSVISAMMAPRPADRPSAALLLSAPKYKVCKVAFRSVVCMSYNVLQCNVLMGVLVCVWCSVR